MTDNNDSNRRALNRLFIGVRLGYSTMKVTDGSDKTYPITLDNVAADSIFFEVKTLLSLNQKVEIDFRLPRYNNIIHVIAKVVRIEQLPKESLYGIAATFTDISNEDKQSIKDCMEWYDITKLLKRAIENNASDVHFLAGQPLFIRRYGELQKLTEERFSEEDIKIFIYSLLSRQLKLKFEHDKELDFAIPFDANNRFRINLHYQQGAVEVAMRIISKKFFDFEKLNIPPIVKDFAGLRDGLVLITGPANAGKTTTIAAMVELINKNRKAMIITLERPIEYTYEPDKSIIKQREIGIDSPSFSTAIKASLRQDPNVIVVGELDDIETIKTAIIAAQAGNLVIASFHAPSAVQALDRLSSLFPTGGRKPMLAQLASCLEGVISQMLLPRKFKQGRVLATEILIVNDAVRRIVRDDDLMKLENVIQTGGARGMHPMSASIAKLVREDLIEQNIADFYTEALLKTRR